MVALPAWAPLRRRAFRALWTAQFVANVGTWAQTVGAQWLMGDLGGGELAVALVQTATTLPVFLLVVPSGALGDIVDRRRLLLTGQAFMGVGAGALAILTAVHLMTPWLLLLLIGVMAVGQAVSVPSYQAIQPELVPRDEIPLAAMLNGANMNLARAAGPALGGALIAAVGPAATFAFNAVSFFGVLLVLYRWDRPPDRRPLGSEHILSATRAGLRYIRNAPRFATVLARSALFMVFASGLWALLPAVARDQLGLSAGGYGLLLAGVGLGAVIGTVVVPGLRDRIGTGAMVNLAMAVFGGTMMAVGLSGSTIVVVGVLLVAGIAWIGVQSTLSATAQMLLPAWTRARALAYMQFVFMGGQALGALGWGAVAEGSLTAAFVIPAAGLLVATLISVRALPLPEARFDVTAVRHWPEPAGAMSVDSEAGPVLVMVEWPVEPAHAETFGRLMRQRMRRSRRRTGATLWGLFQDTGDRCLFVETFTVATWHEHWRQHVERGTVGDRDLETEARGMLLPGAKPHVRHLIWV
ncbi:MFS transporter [Actinocrispum sp. NPDC049592]|uniref:MFS transporter n=1 Tax=Actinocrispum sp. NPDC049592 TaxID=3154835 RepID=UPI003431406E